MIEAGCYCDVGTPQRQADSSCHLRVSRALFRLQLVSGYRFFRAAVMEYEFVLPAPYSAPRNGSPFATYPVLEGSTCVLRWIPSADLQRRTAESSFLSP